MHNPCKTCKKGIGTTVSSIFIIIILIMFLISYVYMINENIQGKTYLNLDEAAMLRTENTFYLLDASLGMTWFISTVQSIFRAGDESIGCGYDESEQVAPALPPVLAPITGSGIEISGRDIYYNGNKLYLVGVSMREALHRETLQVSDGWYDKSLDWYENVLISSGINYVRHDISNDYDMLRRHVMKMRDHGIIVELTLTDGDRYLGDPYRAIEATKDLGNVIYEPVNEFGSKQEDVQIARELTDYIVSQGLIASAGAWSGSSGRHLSDQFDPVNSKNQIITVHRNWDTASISRYLSANKPIIRNEYFRLPGSKMQQIMEESFSAGAAGVNYYPFVGAYVDSLPPSAEHYPVYYQIAQNIMDALNSGAIIVDQDQQVSITPNDMKEGYWYQGRGDLGKPGTSLCTNVIPQPGAKYNTDGCNPKICLPSDKHFENYLLGKMNEFYNIKLELNDVNGVRLIQIADTAKENIQTVFEILEHRIKTDTTQKIYIEDAYSTKIDTTTTNSAVVNTYMKKMVDAARFIVRYLLFVSDTFPSQYQYKQIQSQYGFNGEQYTNYIKSSILSGISTAETENLKNTETGKYIARTNVDFKTFQLKAKTNMEQGVVAELLIHYDGLVRIVEGQKDIARVPGLFEWPTGPDGSRIITSCYGPRIRPDPDASAFHPGLDIAPKANKNDHDTIFPAADGKVIDLRDECGGSLECTGYGNYVVIEHDDGYRTYYAHLHDVSVSVGDNVKKDDIIGHMGTTGTSTGVHLHFEIRKGVPMDPCGFINCGETAGEQCTVLTLSETDEGYYYHDESRNRFVKRPFTLVFGIEDYLPVLRCDNIAPALYDLHTWENTNDMACCGGKLWVCCSDSACNNYPDITDIENMPTPNRKVPGGKKINEHDTSNHCNLPIRCSGGTFIFP